MLDKKDLKDVRVIVQDSLKEFFETLILPYFEHNEKDHAEIKVTLKSHDKRFDDHDKRFDSQESELDSIQRKLERNEDDHDEIFLKLDRIEKHATNHEKRIKRLETLVPS